MMEKKRASDKDRKPRSSAGGSETSRRGFLFKMWMGLLFLAAVQFTALVITFLRPRKPKKTEGSFGGIITAGGVEDFESGSVTAFRRGRFYLVRQEGGGFLALSRECTHLGCVVPWMTSDNRFVCPCHSSEFDMNGEVLSPPAPRALDIFPVVIENDVVRVDTSRPARRNRYEPSQVTYP
jgi:cytochrome b6-f complex iron-sulfur subunit